MAEGLTSAAKDRVVAAAGRAAQHSAWYADRLATCGFSESQSFDNVPVLTEADFELGYHLAPEHDHGAHDSAAFTTSGTSSGVGRRVSWPSADHQRYVEQRAALFRSLMGDSRRTAVADLGTGHAQASAVEIFASLDLEGHEIDVNTPIDRHVAALRKWRPDLLYTMPVILERIVGAAGPRYVPRWIVVLGDPMRPQSHAPVSVMLARLGVRIGYSPRADQPTIAWDRDTWFSPRHACRLPPNAINGQLYVVDANRTPSRPHELPAEYQEAAFGPMTEAFRALIGL